jgi:hypothetical protein
MERTLCKQNNRKIMIAVQKLFFIIFCSSGHINFIAPTAATTLTNVVNAYVLGIDVGYELVDDPDEPLPAFLFELKCPLSAPRCSRCLPRSRVSIVWW